MQRFGHTHGPLRLRNVTIPGCFLDRPEDLIVTDLTILDGIISDQGGRDVEMNLAMVLPCFVDMHTHLDKGHIWPRAANPDGTFMGALTTVGDDRTANWSEDDVYTRMDFALRCAFAHGTRAIRTHLDSISPHFHLTVLEVSRANGASRCDRLIHMSR